MNILIDDFKVESKPYGSGIHHKNYPYAPIGSPKTIAEDYNKGVKFILMDTNIIYYRPNHYTAFSPYGWNHLHKSLMLEMKKGYSAFELDMGYEINIHQCNLRPIINDNRQLRNHPNLTKYLDSFNQKQEVVYHKHNLIDYLRHVYTVLEDYGAAVD